MSEIEHYSLEKTLTDFKVLKHNFKTLFEEKNVRFCGIKSLDQKIVGFHKDKTYYFVSNQGMGTRTLINSIFENFNVLYDENFSIEKNLGYMEYLGGGDTMIKRAGSRFQFLELSEDITVRDLHHKRPTLEDIPEHIQQESDVIISIYKPEYYNIEIWDDEKKSSTKDQIEFTVLKNFKQILGSDKLFFDKENKNAISIQKAFFSEKWMGRMKEYLK